MNAQQKRIAVAFIAILVVLLAWYASGRLREARQQDGGGNSDSRYEVIAANLDIPWSLAFISPDQYLVTERGGTVVLGALGDVVQPERISIPGVHAAGEGGLLGIALHSQFSENHFVYLYHTYRKNGRTLNQVKRFVFENRTLREDRVIIDEIPGNANHNGGRIKFGPDDMLYIGTGDAQIPELAQDVASLAGKILRITPEGGIPEDNPFPDSPVYSFGHRNVQGLAWNQYGDLFATEHGQSAHDELNWIYAGGNYGWPVVQGNEWKEGYQYYLPHRESGEETWAPSGIVLWQSENIVEPDIIFTGLRGQSVYRYTAVGTHYGVLKYFKGLFGRLRDIVIGPDESFYLLTSNRDGRGIPGPQDDRIIRIPPELLY